MNDFSEKRSELVRRMALAAQKVGRGAAQARLMAVTKTQDEGAVREALMAGHRLFGENRVQEAAAKYPALRAQYPDLELHLIGSLQTNKVRQAVALFDAIQTVDRPKLAEALAKEMDRQGRHIPVFVEVNIGQEPQKAGVMPEQVESFVQQCQTEWGLKVRGLMAIPPADQAPGPYFQQMKALADILGLPELSMGMSSDFEEAVAHGATIVRVGTALFGARKKP